jgi:hypothetical protein
MVVQPEGQNNPVQIPTNLLKGKISERTGGVPNSSADNYSVFYHTF